MGAREALLVEALGEIGRAGEGLRGSLVAFETQVLALCEKAKAQAVKHILARTEEAARLSNEQQARAMADAARVAFGADLGATLQRLASSQNRPGLRWEAWLTHAAAAALASAATTVLILWAR